MDPGDLKALELGIGGTMGMLILRAFLEFISRKNDSHECAQLVDAVKSLQTAIQGQTSAMKEQTETISELLTESKLSHQALKVVQRDTEEIRRVQFNSRV